MIYCGKLRGVHHSSTVCRCVQLAATSALLAAVQQYTQTLPTLREDSCAVSLNAFHSPASSGAMQRVAESLFCPRDSRMPWHARAHQALG